MLQIYSFTVPSSGSVSLLQNKISNPTSQKVWIGDLFLEKWGTTRLVSSAYFCVFFILSPTVLMEEYVKTDLYGPQKHKFRH